MRVSDLVKDLIFLVGSVECFAQVGLRERRAARSQPSLCGRVAEPRWPSGWGGGRTRRLLVRKEAIVS